MRASITGWLVLVGVVSLSGALLGLEDKATPKKKLKVFILAGQSNMEGKAKLELLEHQIQAPDTREVFAHLHRDGKWIERDDVWINFLNRRGKLTVGFGSPKCIGPELEFGNVVGDRYEEPVLLLKTAWGGKSLGRDFRPPSAGLPSAEEFAAMLAKENENRKKRNQPEAALEELKLRYGHFYREMLKEVRTNLAELPKRFPELADYKDHYEIAGFVWFQGWNDMFDEDFVENYEERLAHLIRDVRLDLKVPNLPVVIGIMGQNGFKPATGGMVKVKAAQAAVAERPEFEKAVRSIPTDVYWDKKADALYPEWREKFDLWRKTGSDHPYHYLGSTHTFSRIGKAMGEAMLELTTGVRRS